jgi:hypothetical protein
VKGMSPVTLGLRGHLWGGLPSGSGVGEPGRTSFGIAVARAAAWPGFARPGGSECESILGVLRVETYVIASATSR